MVLVRLELCLLFRAKPQAKHQYSFILRLLHLFCVDATVLPQLELLAHGMDAQMPNNFF